MLCKQGIIAFAGKKKRSLHSAKKKGYHCIYEKRIIAFAEGGNKRGESLHFVEKKGNHCISEKKKRNNCICEKKEIIAFAGINGSLHLLKNRSLHFVEKKVGIIVFAEKKGHYDKRAKKRSLHLLKNGSLHL